MASSDIASQPVSRSAACACIRLAVALGVFDEVIPVALAPGTAQLTLAAVFGLLDTLSRPIFLTGGFMKSTISLAEIPESKRVEALEAATEDLIRHLAERFPASQGYEHKVAIYAPKWAWPSGAQSHEQALSMLSPEDRRVAYRRNVRVTRGKAWGLTVDVQTMDRAASRGELMVLAESPLAVLLAVGGLGLGVLLTVAYWFTTDPASGRSLKAAVLLGLVLGGVLAGAGWLVSRPLEGIKPSQLEQISGELSARIGETLARHGRTAA